MDNIYAGGIKTKLSFLLVLWFFAYLFVWDIN